jgi:hypothetical protein
VGVTGMMVSVAVGMSVGSRVFVGVGKAREGTTVGATWFCTGVQAVMIAIDIRATAIIFFKGFSLDYDLIITRISGFANQSFCDAESLYRLGYLLGFILLKPRFIMLKPGFIMLKPCKPMMKPI